MSRQRSGGKMACMLRLLMPCIGGEMGAIAIQLRRHAGRRVTNLSCTGGRTVLRTARLSSLLAALLLLAGCWNRTEVNDLAIVQLTSYDWKDDQYRIAVSYPLVGAMSETQGGGGGTGGKEGQSNYVESAAAPAIRTAFSRVQHKLSRRLYFAHRRVLLIGEALAERGITDILDNLARFPENRISTYMLVTKGDAIDLLQIPVLTERVSAEMFREILVTVMNEPVTAKDFIHAILTEGVDPYTLAFKRTKTETGSKETAADTIQVEGLAVFRGDRLAGILEKQHIDGALLALNQLRRPLITTYVPEGNGTISAQFLEITSRIEPLVDGDEVRIRIAFSGMFEINGNETDLNLIHFENSNKVTRAVEAQMEKQVSAAVKELQTHFRADVLGFGSAVRRSHPRLWKKIGDRWRDLYPKVPVEYRFDIRMEHVGSLNTPIHNKTEENKP